MAAAYSPCAAGAAAARKAAASSVAASMAAQAAAPAAAADVSQFNHLIYYSHRFRHQSQKKIQGMLETSNLQKEQSNFHHLNVHSLHWSLTASAGWGRKLAAAAAAAAASAAVAASSGEIRGCARNSQARSCKQVVLP